MNQTTTDPYASRGALSAAVVERQDPVLYCSSDQPGPLTPTQLSEYDRQGFLVLENLFNAEEITSFQQELARLQQDKIIRGSEECITEPDSASGEQEMRSIFRIHELSALFKKLISDTRLAGAAQQLLDDSLYVHQSRLNFKPGFRGKEFYWHSDFETWHVEDGMPRMRALSISIPLLPNYEQNGPLLLIPGSHRHYLVCAGATPNQHYRQSLKKQEYGVPADAHLRWLAEEQGIFAFTGKPGSAILFDCNCMHGSNGNITPFPRSNLFLVYNAMSNKVGAPFCNQPPRPEYLASRANIYPVTPTARDAGEYRC